MVRPHFRYVGKAVVLWTGARYALAAPESLPGPPPYSPATLIDDQSGQVKTIAQAGCYPVLGQPSTLEPPDLPWVPFSCGWPGQPVPELYSPATGQWQSVSPSPGVVQSCGDTCTDDFLVAAGRYWLEYNHAMCDSGDQHCSYSNVFQDIGTGELRQDPSSATTMVDLNAPDLTRTVCEPLRVPTTFEPNATGPMPGSLTFYGSFAVSIGGDQNGSEVYLERCGTRLHRLLTKAPLAVIGANAHEVVWMAHAGRILNALTFPGLRPFTIRLPNRLVAPTCSQADYTTCVAQIALTNQRLYLLTALPYSKQQLWATPYPHPAKRRRN